MPKQFDPDYYELTEAEIEELERQMNLDDLGYDYEDDEDDYYYDDYDDDDEYEDE